MNFSFIKKDQVYTFIDKYFLYLSLAVVVLIVGAGFTFFVNPTFKEVRQNDVLKVDQKQQELDEDQQYLADLKKLRDQYATVDYNDVQRLATVLPKGFSPQRLYEQLQTMVKNAGLALTSITFSNSVEISNSTTTASGLSATNTNAKPASANAPQVQRVTVNIGISGIDSYSKLKQFVSIVDHEAPILNLSSLSYPILQTAASFSLNTYFLQE